MPESSISGPYYWVSLAVVGAGLAQCVGVQVDVSTAARSSPHPPGALGRTD